MSDIIDYAQLNPAGPSSSVQSAPFVIKSLNRAQYLSPAVETAAITSLAHQTTTHFAGEGRDPNDKATCVTCFDMSGSGKTTTIMEAARLSKSIHAPISLLNNRLFTLLFQSCRLFGRRQDPPLKLEDYVLYEKVEEYMAERFDNMLLLLCQSNCRTAG
ncbi:hypothetical protein MP228_002008 [Amoeboaphelidium protococcarum]|nr:hypothetical protein MP228_002008 [Amoeboaphelidium protococcarum]